MSAVSPIQIRDLMGTIPSWARMLPNMADNTLFSESGMDSLALLELISEIQNRYGVEISDDDVQHISTIADIARYLCDRMQ